MPTMRSLPTLVLFTLLALATFVATASAAAVPPGMPPSGKVMLGVGGSAVTPPTFDKLTGGMHEIHLITSGWTDSRTWDYAIGNALDSAAAHGYRLMVHIGPNRVDNGREAHSPGAVARGEADAYLLDLGRVVNNSGQIVYVRPPAEMNAHWSLWSAFNANGTRRNADHSTRMYRRAFIRIALIVRGGSLATINASLKRNGMPALRTSKDLPSSGKVALVFNPQGRGAPDVAGNQPWDYYPGRAYVDYVANDVYVQHGRANWPANEALYRRYAAVHPFMMGEYAPWGYDDPAFMRKMFSWVTTHPRVVGMLYFNGTSGSTFRLAQKPRSLAAYRVMARQARFRCAGLSATSETC
jgi:hypothetical protein